jgi:FkbM family methyltransferase
MRRNLTLLFKCRKFLSRGFAKVSRSLDPATHSSSGDPSATRRFYNPPSSCQVRELSHLYSLTFGERKDGMAVEVGAFDGESYSNTSCLIDVGWSAVLLEPVPEFAERCRTRHRGNAKVRVLQVASGAASSEIVMSVAGALTSADAAQMSEYDNVKWSAHVVKDRFEITVPVRRLDDVLEECGVLPGFEVLVVDVEGYEAQVWDGFDLQRWRPMLMIWELSDTHPDLVLRRDDSIFIGEQIVAGGYRVIYKDLINTVFVRTDTGEASRMSDGPAA